ncbi:MAG TPA: right-handed parallel beta-helix repeat-containing protein [Iamia sp.]
MRSSRRRGGPRAVLALAAVALLASGGASTPSAAGADADPGLARYVTPAGLPSGPARKDDPDPALTVLSERDKDDERHARLQVGDRRQPFLATPRPGTLVAPMLVVPDRGSPWDLAEVAAVVPSVFERRDDGALLLRTSLLVTTGAELVVDSATVPTLLLASTPLGYVTVRAVYATLRFRGHPDAPLTVASHDPITGRPDDDRRDGRAYVLARGSEMDIRHATLSDLGFATTGHTSGVAWKGADGRRATGGAFDATFERNYFGAYTAEAQGLVIARSAFVDNVIYGFDPHSDTDATLVTDSVAARNGRHGFIFSQSCDGNVVEDSEAYLNGGTGFMIDDGIPPHGPERASDRNRLLRVSSHDNGDVGIVVEGGTGNVVEQAVVTNNEDGIWVRDGAAATDLVGNRVVATRRAAVRLDAGLGEILVADTEIVGAGSGLRLEGDQSEARFDHIEVRSSTGRAVEVRGSALPVAAWAAIDIDTGPGAPFWATWSLASALRTSILGLWAAILALPIAARLLQRSRRWMVSHT